jgi:hypothetical protein
MSSMLTYLVVIVRLHSIQGHQQHFVQRAEL